MSLVEDYRPGYPRFSALIAANADFFVCRRFPRLRARLLLLKQDKLAILESQLDELDRNEDRPLFLGMSRSDNNTARKSLLAEIDSHLAGYDEFLSRSHNTLNLKKALSRDVSSLENWVDATSCISRDERGFLHHERELLTLSASEDSAIKKLEDWVEDLLVDRYKGFRAISQHEFSTDPNVYLYSGPLIKRTARVLMLVIITSLLLVPVVVCILIDSVWARICVIITSTVIYLSILSHLTKSKMIELILAGATYVPLPVMI
ncbi:hypothetical protein PG997_000094 [Apiospora hydei]|uniref:DUF6594 domain-containing protein n=1 Tax=Apiospora hydei TaxID=1337664 RepID=A0ABR1X9Y7_9PEZI